MYRVDRVNGSQIVKKWMEVIDCDLRNMNNMFFQ